MAVFTPTLPTQSRAASLLLAMVLAVAAPAGAAPIEASSADDVCPPDADPCHVTSIVRVANRAVLDFGARTVLVTGGGQFDFGNGDGIIRCGAFLADTNVPTINARGPTGFGGYEGGHVELEARRLCAKEELGQFCLSDSACQFGACGVRRCSRVPRPCAADDECQLGTCNASRRCSNSPTPRACSTNADCDLGQCSEQTTCERLGSVPIPCDEAEDCDLGACSIGDGAVLIDGELTGYASEFSAHLEVSAAGDIDLLGTVRLASDSGGDGGSLEINSGGSVTLAAPIQAWAVGIGYGGSVYVDAAVDVAVDAEIDVAGGVGGGAIDVFAGRDVTVRKSLLASGAGVYAEGGWIGLQADRDLSITSGSELFPTRLLTSGFSDAASTAGVTSLDGRRSLFLGEFTRILSEGTGTESRGGSIDLESEGSIEIDGAIRSTAQGYIASAGEIAIRAGTGLRSGPDSSIGLMAINSAASGGEMRIAAAGPIRFEGEIELRGNDIVVDVVSGSDVVNSGTILLRDNEGDYGEGSVRIEGCDVRLEGEGRLDGKMPDGRTVLVSRERMTTSSGSVLRAEDGTTSIVYRDAAQPPLLQGKVDPLPSLVHEPSLLPCPVCGNAELEDGETCDDGNTAAGDGCNDNCVSEHCIVATAPPGWPEVALCDDADECTTDSCDPADGGACVHVAADCDDGVACTADSCAAGACIHEGEDQACADGNPCTDDTCSPSGCVTEANTAPCDDGDECTGNDACSDGLCEGVHLGLCVVCGDGVVVAPEECDDGDSAFVDGQPCDASCARVPCGHPTNSGSVLPKANDAQFALRAAVDRVVCSPMVCDVDENGAILASDSLRILRAAIGLAIVLRCPAASPA